MKNALSSRTDPSAEVVLAVLELALSDLDELGLKRTAVHLSTAIETLRVELEFTKSE